MLTQPNRTQALGVVLGVALALAGCREQREVASGEMVAPDCGELARVGGSERRPNVLFVVADDLGVQLGAWGDTRVRSPNLDALANRGVRFEHAYCQYPLCNPSRVSFLSGKLPLSTGVLDNNTAPAADGTIYLPRLFGCAGYHTVRIGKLMHSSTYEGWMGWSVEARRRKRRGRALAVDAEAEAAFDARPVERIGALSWRTVPDEAAALLPDSQLVDQAIFELRRAVDRQPFFLAVGLVGPHQPFEAPDSLFEAYAAAQERDEPRDHRSRVLPASALQRARQLVVTREEEATLRAAYFASVSFLDRQIGVLLAELERLGLADDTIVVFLSDHGYQIGENGGLWSKLTLFEEALQVPLIVAAPGFEPGTVPWPVELLDLYPTLAELAGLPRAPGLAGESLVPRMRAPSDPFRRGAFSMLGVGHEEVVWGLSVRNEAYRYTEWGGPVSAELYDHREDPTESLNLVKRSNRRPDRKGLQAKMRKLRDR